MSQPGNINGMYKTFCTKYTHYAPDGNGRDKFELLYNYFKILIIIFYNIFRFQIHYQ